MKQKALTPPDKKRCQAMVPTGGQFQVGGEIGDPKDGYRIRCRNTPTVIATENEPGEDGLIGEMSLCNDCLKVFRKQMPKGFATIITIYRDPFADEKIN